MKLVADFETTPYTQYLQEEETRVWLWYYEDADTNHKDMGMEIDDFFKSIVKYKNSITKGKKTISVYFHNLKFDAQFIIQHLLNKGFTFKHYGKLDAGEMKALISDLDVYYILQVRYNYRLTIKFLDSLKLLPMPVAKLPNSQKVKFAANYDYDKIRNEKNLSEVSEDDKKYIINDVKIVKENLNKLFAAGLTKMTTASNAMYYYKSIKVDFTKIFPELSDVVLNTLRRAYSGGFTYLNPKYKNKIINEPVRSYDVNSLYPSQMYLKPLPYGRPYIWREGEKLKVPKNYKLAVHHIYIDYAKLKKGRHPFFSTTSNFHLIKAKNYAKEIQAKYVYLTNVDLKQLEEHYDINYQIIGSAYFKAKVGFFKEYIDYWYKKKKEAKPPFDKFLAKLFLNSLYGKFAANNIIVSKHLEQFDGERYVWYKSETKARVKQYLPMGIFITSYARYVTIDAIQKNADRFIYADTDSIHLIGRDLPQGIELDEEKLGAWKDEGLSTETKFLGCKQYIKRKKGKIEPIIAGVSKNQQHRLNFNNFYTGSTIEDAKLKAKTVRGGCVLIPEQYTFK